MTPEAKTKIAQAYAATSCAAGILTLGEGTPEQRIATALRLTTEAANTLGELMAWGEDALPLMDTLPEALDRIPGPVGITPTPLTLCPVCRMDHGMVILGATALPATPSERAAFFSAAHEASQVQCHIDHPPASMPDPYVIPTMTFAPSGAITSLDSFATITVDGKPAKVGDTVAADALIVVTYAANGPAPTIKVTIE